MAGHGVAVTGRSALIHFFLGVSWRESWFAEPCSTASEQSLFIVFSFPALCSLRAAGRVGLNSICDGCFRPFRGSNERGGEDSCGGF